LPPLRDLESNTYRGLHAAYYDLIYADKPYAEEARFVAGAVTGDSAGGPRKLLDLACGTGRHAFEFAAMGHTVTGVDYSDELLDVARQNAESRGADVRFVNQDLRELDIDGRPFDVITCLFDSIGYLLTNDGIVAALSRAREHLSDRGTLAVEFLHAAAVLRHAAPVRVRRWQTPAAGTLLRISEVELDVARQTMRVDYELLDIDAAGQLAAHWSEVQTNRFFSVEEMRALIQSAGLVADRFVPAYQEPQPIDDNVWHVLALARTARASDAQ
jgi:SAM-dependent methyltransferase